MNRTTSKVICNCSCHDYEGTLSDIRPDDPYVECRKCKAHISVKVPKHIPDSQREHYIDIVGEKFGSLHRRS